MKGAGVSITKVRSFLKLFDNLDISKNEALKKAGINEKTLLSPDNRLAYEEVNNLFKLAVKLTDDIDIGLKQGFQLDKGFSNILGYILMNCKTLGEAAEKFTEYEQLVHELSRTELECKKHELHISFLIKEPLLSKNRQYSDYIVAGFISYMNLLTRKPITIKSVNFNYQCPEEISKHKELFQCPITFNKKCNKIIFDKNILKLPTVEPNKELLEFFEKKAAEILKKYESNQSYTKKVTNIVLGKINRDIPSIIDIAGELALSSRTLQMYLKSEGTSYTSIINDIKKEIATNYLKENIMSIDEIAYTLGFSDSSSFYKAFKRWTDHTPGEYRQNVLQL